MVQQYSRTNSFLKMRQHPSCHTWRVLVGENTHIHHDSNTYILTTPRSYLHCLLTPSVWRRSLTWLPLRHKQPPPPFFIRTVTQRLCSGRLIKWEARRTTLKLLSPVEYKVRHRSAQEVSKSEARQQSRWLDSATFNSQTIRTQSHHVLRAQSIPRSMFFFFVLAELKPTTCWSKPSRQTAS